MAETTGHSSLPSATVGWFMPGSTVDLPVVDFAENPLGPRLARNAVSLTTDDIQRGIQSRAGVLLVFENGDPGLPIVTGLIRTRMPQPLPALLEQVLDGVAESPSESAPDLRPARPIQTGVVARPSGPPAEARVDGKRVVLEGSQEVILRCGEASITLRKDGKVILRGTYLETNSKGLNRIKGASVKIN